MQGRAKNTNYALPKSSSNTSIQGWIVAGGMLLLGAKFAAWLLTGSNAILTDALESIINVVAGLFALYSLWLAAKPRDEDHPYGHGKIEFIAASVEGALIGLAGLIIIGKSVYNLVYPHEISHLDTGIWIVAGAGAVNYFMGWLAIRQGRKSHSITLEADGKHLQSDAWSSAGILVGLVIIWLTGLNWLDNVVAILFGIIIMVTGYRILSRSIAGIMDEADYELLGEMIEALDKDRSENCIDMHNLRVIKYGSMLHVDCHITVPWYFNIRQAHIELEHVENILNRQFGNRAEVFIHTDPCLPESCPHCLLKDCDVRQKPFARRIPWTLEIVMQNRKHGKSIA